MSTNTRARHAAEAAAEHGRAVLDEARKPLFAVVGAGEWAVSALRELPAEARTAVDTKLRPTVDARLKLAHERVGKAQEQVGKLQEELTHTLADVRRRAGEAQARAQEKVSAFDRAEVRSTVEEYLDRARHTYAELAERGEKLLNRGDDLRPGPAQGEATRATDIAGDSTASDSTTKAGATEPGATEPGATKAGAAKAGTAKAGAAKAGTAPKRSSRGTKTTATRP